MLDSILDDVPGIGPGRKKQLLRKFGSLARLKDAAVPDLEEVIPTRVAAELYAALHGAEDGRRA